MYEKLIKQLRDGGMSDEDISRKFRIPLQDVIRGGSDAPRPPVTEFRQPIVKREEAAQTAPKKERSSEAEAAGRSIRERTRDRKDGSIPRVDAMSDAVVASLRDLRKSVKKSLERVSLQVIERAKKIEDAAGRKKSDRSIDQVKTEEERIEKKPTSPITVAGEQPKEEGGLDIAKMAVLGAAMGIGGIGNRISDAFSSISNGVSNLFGGGEKQETEKKEELLFQAGEITFEADRIILPGGDAGGVTLSPSGTGTGTPGVEPYDAPTDSYEYPSPGVISNDEGTTIIQPDGSESWTPKSPSGKGDRLPAPKGEKGDKKQQGAKVEGAKPSVSGDNGSGLQPHQKALLDTIAGPESKGKYNVIYGGSTFSDYADHPRKAVRIKTGPNAGKTSSAAGKYQFLGSTWDEYKKKLDLKDFSPANQDKAAWALAADTYKKKTGRELDDVLQNGTDEEIAQVGKYLAGKWTSLPGGIEAGTNTSRFTKAFRNYHENHKASQFLDERQGPRTRGGRRGTRVEELPKANPERLADWAGPERFDRPGEIKPVPFTHGKDIEMPAGGRSTFSPRETGVVGSERTSFVPRDDFNSGLAQSELGDMGPDGPSTRGGRRKLKDPKKIRMLGTWREDPDISNRLRDMQKKRGEVLNQASTRSQAADLQPPRVTMPEQQSQPVERDTQKSPPPPTPEPPETSREDHFKDFPGMGKTKHPGLGS